MKRIRQIHKKLKPWYVIVLLILLWWAASEQKIWNSYLMPPPAKVLRTFLSMLEKGEIARAAAVSLRRVLTGFLISFSLAFAGGMIAAYAQGFAGYFTYLGNFFRNVPPLALISLLILWFGLGETPKLIIIVLASFFPMLMNISSGFIRCDVRLLEVGKSLGFSGIKRFFRISLPAARLDILTGIRIGLGYAWRALIGAEMFAAATGLGYMIVFAQQMSRSDKVFIGIFLIGMIGSLTDALLQRLINRLSRETDGTGEGRIPEAEPGRIGENKVSDDSKDRAGTARTSGTDGIAEDIKPGESEEPTGDRNTREKDEHAETVRFAETVEGRKHAKAGEYAETCGSVGNGEGGTEAGKRAEIGEYAETCGSVAFGEEETKVVRHAATDKHGTKTDGLQSDSGDRIELSGISKQFTVGDGVLTVLQDLNLDIPANEITVVLGKSGCGKTTLLRMIAGLDEEYEGTIRFPGQKKCAVVFQESRLMPWLSVRKNSTFGLKKSAIREEWIQELFSITGLSGFEKAKPSQLSGGMEQRTAIARALAVQPEFLLMDEPFAALDYFTREAMQKSLLQIQRQTGCGILFITHSIDEALILADHIVILANRRVFQSYHREGKVSGTFWICKSGDGRNSRKSPAEIKADILKNI